MWHKQKLHQSNWRGDDLYKGVGRGLGPQGRIVYGRTGEGGNHVGVRGRVYRGAIGGADHHRPAEEEMTIEGLVEQDPTNRPRQSQDRWRSRWRQKGEDTGQHCLSEGPWWSQWERGQKRSQRVWKAEVQQETQKNVAKTG